MLFRSELFKMLTMQVYKDFEIVIVDSSDDKTKEMIEKWISKGDLRIRFFSIPRSGVSSARNYALDHCEGRYVCFLDADDIISQFFLDELVLGIEEGYVPFAYYTRDLQKCREIKKEDIIRKQLSVSEMADILMYRKPPVNFWCMLYDRKIIENFRLRFSEDIAFGEDGEFMWKYLSHCKGGVFVYAPLNGYRIHAESNSYKKTDRIIEALLSLQRAQQYAVKYSKTVSDKLLHYLLPRTKIVIAKDFCRQRRYDAFKTFRLTYWKTEDYRKIKKYANQSIVVFANFLLQSLPGVFYFLLNIYYRLFSKRGNP